MKSLSVSLDQVIRPCLQRRQWETTPKSTATAAAQVAIAALAMVMALALATVMAAAAAGRWTC